MQGIGDIGKVVQEIGWWNALILGVGIFLLVGVARFARRIIEKRDEAIEKRTEALLSLHERRVVDIEKRAADLDRLQSLIEDRGRATVAAIDELSQTSKRGFDETIRALQAVRESINDDRARPRRATRH